MTWNTNIQEAPQDRRVWLATKCERVSVTRWNEKRGAWDGLATGEEPIAWQSYVVPVHPNFIAPGETGMVLGTGRERPLSIGLHTDGDPEARFETASLHQHPILDDCGSGA